MTTTTTTTTTTTHDFIRNRRFTSQSKRRLPLQRYPNEYSLLVTITNVNRLPLTLQYNLTKDGLPVYNEVFKQESESMINNVKKKVFPLGVDTSKGNQIFTMDVDCMPKELLNFTRKGDVTCHDGLVMTIEGSSNAAERGMIKYRCTYFK